MTLGLFSIILSALDVFCFAKIMKNNPLPKTGKRFASFRVVREIYKDVFRTDNSLRHVIFNADSNGLDAAISRLGRKIIFDLDVLDEWLTRGYGNDV